MARLSDEGRHRPSSETSLIYFVSVIYYLNEPVRLVYPY